jgi:hypothetical protein
MGVTKERLVAKNGKQVAKEGSLEMGGCEVEMGG